MFHLPLVSNQDFQKLTDAYDLVTDRLRSGQSLGAGAGRSGGAEDPMSIAKRVFAKHPVICWCSPCQKALVAASKCRGCLEGGPHTCGHLTALSGHYKQNKVKILFHLVHDSCTEAEAIVKYMRQKKVVPGI